MDNFYNQNGTENNQGYNQYGQPYNNFQQPQVSENEKVMSVGSWLVTQLLLCIPIVNIILIIVWAVGGKNTNKNKSNFFRAYLILAAITFVVVFVLMFSLGIFFNTLKKANKIDFEELEKTKFNYNITIEQRI